MALIEVDVDSLSLVLTDTMGMWVTATGGLLNSSSKHILHRLLCFESVVIKLRSAGRTGLSESGRLPEKRQARRYISRILLLSAAHLFS